MSRSGTFKEWKVMCPSCQHVEVRLAWDYDLPIPCSQCGANTDLDYIKRNKAPGVVCDDIPGGLNVQHGTGLINNDGSPKKYYSRTDLKRAMNENGWTLSGDTPKPYKVNWSGRARTSGGLPIKEQ